MSINVIGFILVFATFAIADGTKVVRCRTTFRSMNDPACSMITEDPNNEMMCTNIDVKAGIGGYFSVEDGVEPICITYIFKSTYELGGDYYPRGIWLFRSTIFDNRIKTCESVCREVREATINTSYTNLYVGCSRTQEGNDEDVDTYWDIQSPYDCSTDDKYFNSTKNFTIVPPWPTTQSTPKTSTSSIWPTSSGSSASSASSASSPSSASSASSPSSASSGSSGSSTQSTVKTTPPPYDPDEKTATLFVGIGEGVVGAVGTGFIVTSNIVLFLQLKQLRSGGIA